MNEPAGREIGSAGMGWEGKGKEWREREEAGSGSVIKLKVGFPDVRFHPMQYSPLGIRGLEAGECK